MGEVKQLHLEMEARLGALEAKPVGSSVAGSTADTDQGRIIGGWHPDTTAEDTLKGVKEVGLRRGDTPSSR